MAGGPRTPTSRPRSAESPGFASARAAGPTCGSTSAWFPQSVEWACVAQSIERFQPEDEWVGTTIGFELTQTEGGTRLDFVHRGLRQLGCIDLCDAGWQFHIGQSLKALVEK